MNAWTIRKLCDPRDQPDGEANWRATLFFILRSIKQTILTILALYFSAVTTPVLAQAAIIDASMGGGTLIGKECVNGRVAELGADFGSRSINLLRAGSMTRISQHHGGYYFA